MVGSVFSFAPFFFFFAFGTTVFGTALPLPCFPFQGFGMVVFLDLLFPFPFPTFPRVPAPAGLFKVGVGCSSTDASLAADAGSVASSFPGSTS